MNNIITVLILSLSLGGCVLTSKKEESFVYAKEDISNKIENHNFILGEINNESILYRKGLNITFKKGRGDINNFVSGSTGCNRFFGNYNIENDFLIFNDIKSTKKTCTSKEDLRVEKIILNILDKRMTVNLEENGFSLSEGSDVLKFKNYKK